MKTIIGVDVGGTQIRAARFESNLEVVEVHKTETYPGGVAKVDAEKQYSSEDLQKIVFERLVEAISKVLPADKSEVQGIGLALPGPVNSDSGTLIAPPALPFRNFSIRDEVQKALDIPICIGNDADLAGLAEFHHPRGARAVALKKLKLKPEDVRYMIYFTVSTGVGSGIILDGKHFNGRGQGAEAGHMMVDPDGPMCGCGHRGHLEALSSGTAIAKITRRRIEEGESSIVKDLVEGDLTKISAKIVASAAAQGDKLAVSIFEQAGRYLGVAVASMMVLFNPDMLVFGGSVTRAGDLLFNPMGGAIREFAMHPLYWEKTPICLAELGDDVGLYGAAALVNVMVSD